MRKWTTQEDEILRTMYATNTRAQIAAALDRGEAAVRTRCWTLRLAYKSAPKWTTSEVDAMRTWYAERVGGFLSLPDLAKQLGRLHSNVCRKARSLGLTDVHRKWRKERRKYATLAEAKAALSEATKRWIREKGHPRGALGMKHSAETKARIGIKSAMFQANRTPAEKRAITEKAQATLMARYGRLHHTNSTSAYSRTKKGKRADLGDACFRSAWEANYARYLNWQKSRGEIVGWEYEADTYWFDAIKRGTRSYTPDFRVTLPDGSVEQHEVKGWMDPKSKVRLRRMKKYHPSVVVVLIDEKRYRGLDRGIGRLLPNWE